VELERPQPLHRIVLRPATPADADLLQAWRSEASVARYQPLGRLSRSQLRAELAAQQAASLREGRGEKFQWIILCEEEPVGWVTLVVTNWEHGLAEIGYALTTDHQRRGITPQALHLLLSDLFLTTPLERIEARCAVDNEGSRKVLEAVGFRREGILRRYFQLGSRRVDNYLFAILRDDFLP
jgi:RimJ/RimL family protein N-acetyltransferase